MVIRRLDLGEPQKMYATMRAKDEGGIMLLTDSFAVELSTENLLDMTSIVMEQIREKADKYRRASDLFTAPQE